MRTAGSRCGASAEAQDQGIRADAGHPANLTRPWKLIRVLATSTHWTERPRGEQVPVEDEAVFGPPGEESVDACPSTASATCFAVTNRFPQLGHRQRDVHRATARGYLRPDLRSWLGARDGAGCDRRALQERGAAPPSRAPTTSGSRSAPVASADRPARDRRGPRRSGLPLVLGHQVVGVVDALGTDVETLELGLRVGVPWLRWTCGTCRFCRSGRENLCPEARFTGFQLPGGFAEGIVVALVPADPRLPGPAGGSVALCRVIGWRCLKLAGQTDWGSTASARPPSRRAGRALAGTRAVRVHAPATSALRRSRASSDAHGRVAPMSTRPRSSMPRSSSRRPVSSCRARCRRRPGGHGGVRRDRHERHPVVPLRAAGERVLRSVANLTYADGSSWSSHRGCRCAPASSFPLARANEALAALRSRSIDGAIVLEI